MNIFLESHKSMERGAGGMEPRRWGNLRFATTWRKKRVFGEGFTVLSSKFWVLSSEF
jgi:hypothetical protein